MGRYEYTTTTFFLSIMFLFCLCPMVLSMLSQNQTNTMITLSQILNTSVPIWNSIKEPNPCLWKGVTCDTSGSFVTMITLSKHSLTSNNFMNVLCQIETLEYLDVSNNQITSIPDGFLTECGKNKGLNLLNFTRNNLHGVLPTFHGFDGLEYLDMSFNNLGGTIGLELDELVSLKSLNLSFNSFNGSLPIHLGKLMILEKLMLSQNNFSGKIPDEILTYKKLTVIDLSGNHLSGTIPSNIGELPKLESLILSCNSLDGGIPISLRNITTLTRFAANQNNFIGAVPIGITTYLTSLDLSYNKLESIPEDLLSPSKLQVVDFSTNKLSGPLPVNISSSLTRLRLGGNFFTGSIPSGSFPRAKNLTYLELENNHLTGVIPVGLGSCQNLALLSLAKNQLSGVLPAELGNLRQLQVLKLQMNKFNGTIPVQIGQLQKLSTLNLSCNSLEGSIPSVMSSLSSLTVLNLQQNNLSGSIPTSIGNLRFLIELQLGKNQLSGVIPSMPLSLQIALNLSSNLFSGPIPSSLGYLTTLEILDLSNNRFSGEIPKSLGGMPALTQIILSNNQLSGMIPKFSPYVHVESKGNTNLVNNTGQDNTTPNVAPRSTKTGISVVAAVLISIAASIFLIALVALIIVLVSRNMYKVNDEHIQPSEDSHLPRVIHSNLFTSHVIHRANIDFSKAMEAVAVTSNVTLKTRFSTYYKAIMPSGSIYFVKKLNWSDKISAAASSNDKFVIQLEMLAKLNNSNVMTPLAYVISNDIAYVLYEFVSNGSLFDVLHGSMAGSLDWASRYSIAVGVAQGISFLHGHASSSILLLDLSSKSIMLKSFKEPLVGDIEHYKVIDPSKSTGNFSAVAGSVGYIPPEYAYTMTVTMAGNVYSFGVILLELLTGKPAVTEGTELVKWVLHHSTNKDYILDFNVKRTSQAVRNQMLAVLKIALVCVSTSPEARPKMKSVLRMLLNAR
ncbi:PREDICTED: leucine-rich repeat receptor-like tyrosine-protein kinase PXC3 [Lupinus angustifolius]|nr:PREDICTED: leucine-rich repeat receptor-like tyrosine-protein kinase PXC3 [Lupinus angustifolius]